MHHLVMNKAIFDTYTAVVNQTQLSLCYKLSQLDIDSVGISLVFFLEVYLLISGYTEKNPPTAPSVFFTKLKENTISSSLRFEGAFAKSLDIRGEKVTPRLSLF